MTVIAPNPVMEAAEAARAKANAIERMDGPKEIGKDSFLKLLVAQMKYQDPMNPMEGTEFTAQLAQYTSLEQLTQINEQFTGMNTSLKTQNAYQAVDLVGKEVLADGNSFQVQKGASTGAILNLPEAAAETYIDIYDEDGDFVRGIQLGAVAAGQHSITWDALDARGKSVPDGQYAFEFTAYDADGLNIPVETQIAGKVDGVVLNGSEEAILLIGKLGVKLSDIKEIVNPATPTAE